MKISDNNQNYCFVSVYILNCLHSLNVLFSVPLKKEMHTGLEQHKGE